jgi:hypothetical protein
MFLEYSMLLGLDWSAPLSLEFISNILLIIASGLLLLLVGFKIKGTWGAVIALAAGTALFLYQKGILIF